MTFLVCFLLGKSQSKTGHYTGVVHGFVIRTDDIWVQVKEPAQQAKSAKSPAPKKTATPQKKTAAKASKERIPADELAARAKNRGKKRQILESDSDDVSEVHGFSCDLFMHPSPTNSTAMIFLI